ncbi:hypothetical protein CLOSTMETH_03893 [[Clostridium] methylpentosum DSM 5476]|uniref:Uncharacterized protein n=1 Tax=[Clostridium] methylpentosum DSM 5476 TaxID=537013 RepID=C0EJ47_9FIRM|nr:hypothetical protein CLOSTMETH_03893 [[Clostridium] methylpentosum DSM 5476]
MELYPAIGSKESRGKEDTPFPTFPVFLESAAAELPLYIQRS